MASGIPPKAVYIDSSVTPTGRGVKVWYTRPDEIPFLPLFYHRTTFLHVSYLDTCMYGQEFTYACVIKTCALLTLRLFSSAVLVAWICLLAAAATWSLLWTLYLFSDCLPMEWGSYGLNLHDTLNLAESSSLRIIMIFLLLLLYIISLVTVVQFSHPGTTTEEGERIDCKARFLEGWPVGKIVIFPEYLAWLYCIFVSTVIPQGQRVQVHLCISG